MILVLLGLGVALSVFGFYLDCRRWSCGEPIATVGIVLTGIFFFITLLLLSLYPYGIDERIEMYTTENANIEEKIKNTVVGYMEFENETLTNLIKDADLTTLLVKYPELNSNELVKMEIETYKENSKQIKELKEDKIDAPLIKWWLHFGK